MGLFSKKKKLPEFPKLPEKPSFPEYKQHLPPMPKQPAKQLPRLPPLQPEEEFNMPIRRPIMPRPRPIPPQEIAPIVERPSGPQPLFVKIDRYKAAINALSDIKQKLSEAEATLTKLNAIKLREGEEISRWEQEIVIIKEKLMAIDRELFEV